ncbi:MAG: hypothetical protein OXI58_00435 [Gemmatimonadota bacterium]|nr:hypothetical protein [Gemmatimonadota bacterium]
MLAISCVEELNNRFKEHGVGYQFTNGQIICIDSEFIHTEVVKPALKLLDQQHYAGLESSVPTGRNKLSGHGQGTTPVSVPDHLVAYMLHMTASAIVFLAEADKNSP